jgi:hypothetical protein
LKRYRYVARGSKFYGKTIEVLKWTRGKIVARDVETGETFIGIARCCRRLKVDSR